MLRNTLILCGLLLIITPLTSQADQSVKSTDKPADKTAVQPLNDLNVDDKTLDRLAVELYVRRDILVSLNVTGYGKPLHYSSDSCVKARSLIDQWINKDTLRVSGYPLILVLYNSGCITEKQFYSRLENFKDFK